MQNRIFILLLSALAIQSCAERADKQEVTTSQEATTTEPAFASEPANVTTVPTQTADANNSVATSETNATRNSRTAAVKKTPATLVVSTESKTTPGFKASYQVPRAQYNKEKRAVANRQKEAAQYQPVTVQKGNMRATYDLPGDDYRGEDVRSHDGVKKNKERNMNYLDNSVTKVPNDGGSFEK